MTDFPVHTMGIHELFSLQAAKVHDAIAVKSATGALTYQDLDRRSDALAAHLQQLAPDSSIVGISSLRVNEMITGILAILKAGKAYLPLDANYPEHRLKTIVADAGLKICLSADQETSFFEGLGLTTVSFTALVEPAPLNQSTTGLAYVLYTSGSTGVPKGVAMGHAALVNLIEWQNRHSLAGNGSATLQFSPLTFDVSFQEIFATLTTGGTLVMMEEHLRQDPLQLLTFMEDQQIFRLFLPFVALQYLSEAAESAGRAPSSLKELITAGEQLKITPQLAGLMNSLENCTLFNQYGPTECHVVSSLALTGDPAVWPLLPSIGTAIDRVSLFIIDEEQRLVDDGREGELVIAGACLAEGYLNNPQLTDAKFISWQHPEKGRVRIYLTGDLAKVGTGKQIEFLGRKDSQVKIRGHRVEPGEIEVVLTKLPGVQQAVVIAVDSEHEGKRLNAYLTASGEEYDTATLRAEVSQLLPDYMVPSVFHWLEDFPMTPSGKIDRKTLPTLRVKQEVAEKQPVLKESERKIFELWTVFLQVPQVGLQQNFFEIGGNSLLALKTVSSFKKLYGIDLPITKIYQLPTIKQLAAYLDGDRSSAGKSEASRRKGAPAGKDIAIIGLSGRFPGADDPAEFWDNIKNGRESVKQFSKEELDASLPEALKNSPAYVKARGVITDPDAFDAHFFGIVPAHAEVMDPQHRIFLELSWEVLESTGYAINRENYRIGVFAGCGNNTYYQHNILPNKALIDRVGAFQVMTLNEKDYIATRTAFHLGLTGPAVSVLTACSTSLLAISQAVENIRSGRCELAIAGGVSITSPVNSGHLYEEGSMFSPDGHTRSFDSAAAGTVFSDGAGVILLKDLEAAIRDGDTVYAVIKGVGYNNDGGDKGSFTAPSAAGQAGAIEMAMEDAGISDPSAISFIEAHGTATPIGDPIEIEGLTLAFGETTKKQFCAIGSVKSNIGHLTAAAGVAGLIKVAFSLYHKQLPPTINYTRPNPAINFTDGPFYVNDRLQSWSSGSTRIAGVSSFGVGGTNVHVLLAEAPGSIAESAEEKPAYLFPWSAKTERAAQRYAVKLAGFIEKHPETSAAELAFTLSATRKDFPCRKFRVAASVPDLLLQLKQPGDQEFKLEEEADEIAFLFPGQGAQFPGMGAGLYASEAVFKTAVDECAALLLAETGEDIRELLFDKAATALDNTKYTQPALFVVEYALAKLWMSRGIIPSVVLGHSIGEFVAAHLAGIFNLPDALKLIAARGRLITALPPGNMLALKIGEQELNGLLPAGLSIAAYNSKDLHVVSGEPELVTDFSALLQNNDIPFRPVKTSHAFHSKMMDPVLEAFADVVNSVKLNPPRVPIISTVTGSWMSEEMAIDPAYWVKQLREPVRFAGAVTTVTAGRRRILLEVGPGNGTYQLVNAAIRGTKHVVLPGFERDAEYASSLSVLGKLWLQGAKPEWNALYGGRKLQRLTLPSYAFEKSRYWIEPLVAADALPSASKGTLPEQHDTSAALNPGKQHSGIIRRVLSVLESASGIPLQGSSPADGFIALGLDSLILTMVALQIKSEFKVPVSFRQLNGELSSPQKLAEYLEQQGAGDSAGTAASSVFRPAADFKISAAELEEIKKPFGATARIDVNISELSAKQHQFLKDFTARYTLKTRKSKEYTAKHRPYMADPRAVSGFKRATKEIVYPIVVNRSKGSHVWDLDGNDYIDALNGFGSNFLGYQHEVIKKAITEQIELGYEIGPQHELAGEVCRLICDLTRTDRAALCNTGSEAVLGAMRIARTVTGRSMIASFNGSYHGINDEVIVRGTKNLKAFPAAPGIMPEAVENMLVLDYGTDEALDILREKAPYLAAILVEPVQSRRPEFVPIDFLKALKKIAVEFGTVLIFDEVITGFRMSPGGAQEILGIEADLGTYGKVVGGGLPIGIIAGKKAFMDALDGGAWQFGDDSVPEVGVTYFAGTFVRHPLALAAARASLLYMKMKGHQLQDDINAKTTALANGLNKVCTDYKLPVYAVNFGSLWKLKFSTDVPYHELIFALMREKGIHILDIFPCFLTEAHTEMEVNLIIRKFEESIQELIAHEFLSASNPISQKNGYFAENVPPVKGARLGRDREGNPAWFVPDQANPGKYLQVEA